MNREDLFRHIIDKQSYLCIGLDADIAKIPPHLQKYEDPIFEFNKQIIDATHAYCVAYKPNVAFYEALGSQGWDTLQKTVAYIPQNIFTIADAKRGDIRNTSEHYARSFFERMNFDAVTVSPYMGEDSVIPFLKPNKWAIILAYTSNMGSKDFQTLSIGKSQRTLYEEVMLISQQWGSENQIMYVVGATHGSRIKKIRQLLPNHFLLIPGVGIQGGDLEMVSTQAMNQQCGILVNMSRSIIYAGHGKDFAKEAQKKAHAVQQIMKRHIEARF